MQQADCWGITAAHPVRRRPTMAGRDHTPDDRSDTLRSDTVRADTVRTAGARADGATVTRGAGRDAVAAQHARFGGIQWGAAFFGWLSANGLAVILIALLSAGGLALGLAQGVDTADEAVNQANDIGIGGGIAILVALFLAYLAGGYVAGRMA